ncbi:T-cell receptor beta chain [Arapaima gigas]
MQLILLLPSAATTMRPVSIAILALWLTGPSDCLTVRQTPAELIKNPEDNITLTCSHHDSSFDKMLWYQQVHGEGLRLLGLLSFKEVLEQQDGFSISGDAEKEAFLQITSARPQHTAVYMCAVSKAQCYRPLVSCAGTAAEPGRLLVTVHVKLDKAHFWVTRFQCDGPWRVSVTVL